MTASSTTPHLTHPTPAVADPQIMAELAAAMRSHGLTVDQLLQQATQSRAVTVTEAIGRFLDSRPLKTAQRYRTPLVLLRDGWSVPADEVEDVRALAGAANLTIPPTTTLARGPRLPLWTADETAGLSPSGPGDRVVLLQGLGDRPLASLNGSELQVVARWARLRGQHFQMRRNATRREAGHHVPDYDGRGAQQAFRNAVRALYTMAGGERDIDIAPGDTCAKTIAKPPSGNRRRRALTDSEYQQAWDESRLEGPDPELDAMLFRLHSNSGARRDGALTLTVERIDPDKCVLKLHEKGQKVRDQPVPPSLVLDLLEFARSRGADRPTDTVLRYRDGRPLTYRHYDGWHRRIQQAFGWADAIGFGSHVLRFHVAVVVERIGGHAVAETFLGHEPDTVTGLYTKATQAEVATVVQTFSGEPHPLAPGPIR